MAPRVGTHGAVMKTNTVGASGAGYVRYFVCGSLAVSALAAQWV